MELIKKGSKGNSVKELLKLLGLSLDGIFGNNTELAVKLFLKSKGLTADGIVGDKTWKLLLGNSLASPNSLSIDSKVTYSPLNVHITKCINRPIKYLAIHYTAGGSSTTGRALANKLIFLNRLASADFAVDDTTMVLFNPDLNNYYCWAVGDKKNPYSTGGTLYGIATNKNTISIEICSNLKSGTTAKEANHEGWYFTEQALKNALYLAKIIMNKYNIPLSNVIRHYDVSGKLCPGIVGWNNESICDSKTGKATKEHNNSILWNKFKEELK